MLVDAIRAGLFPHNWEELARQRMRERERRGVKSSPTLLLPQVAGPTPWNSGSLITKGDRLPWQIGAGPVCERINQTRMSHVIS